MIGGGFEGIIFVCFCVWFFFSEVGVSCVSRGGVVFLGEEGEGRLFITVLMLGVFFGYLFN